jgi:hypothetical protein
MRGKPDDKVRQTSRFVQMLGTRRRDADLRRQSSSDGGTHHRYLVVLLRDDVVSEAPKLNLNLMVKEDCVLKLGSTH